MKRGSGKEKRSFHQIRTVLNITLKDLRPGLVATHIDTTVIIERPHVSPVRERIRATLADVLGLPVEHVNVKATRGEGMGFIGREEGAAALAVATLTHAQPPPHIGT